MKSRIFIAFLCLLLMVTTPALATVDLCSYLEDMKWAAVSVDPKSNFLDVYLGTGDKWKEHDSFKRYILPDDTKPAAPDQMIERIDKLIVLFDVSKNFEVGNGPSLRNSLQLQLKALRDRIVPLQAQTVVSWQVEKDFVDTTFDRSEGTSVCNGSTFTSNSVFLEDSLTVPPLVLNIDKMVLVEGLPSFENFRYIATLEQAVEIRAIVTEIQQIFTTLQLVAVNRATIRLHTIDQAWSNYLEKGYSQYPWESLLNSYVGTFSWTEAPKSQWVLLHPEVAALADIRATSGASVEGALLLHGLGYIRYFGDKRDWYTGLSATASLTTDESFGAGAGATLHFGHTSIYKSIPHVSVGILWHDFKDGSSGPILGISLDFWRLLNSDNAEDLYQKAIN